MGNASALTGAVSGAVAAALLTAAVLMFKVGNKQAPRVITIFVLVGCVGLIPTPVGRWADEALQWSFNEAGRIAGKWVSPTITGSVIATLVAIGTLYVLYTHLQRKSLDKVTLGSAAIAPFTVTAITGPGGSLAIWAIGGLAGAVSSAIGHALGWS